MEDENHSSSTDEVSQDEMLRQARQLLTLTDLVERYPSVIAKRVNGLIFVLIGGGISLAGLIFITIMPYFESSGLGLLSVLAFISMNLIISWAISFRLIAPLVESYGDLSSNEPMSTEARVFWGIIAATVVIATLVSFGTGQVFLFAPIMQGVLFLGNTANYFEAKRDKNQESVSFAFLVYAVVIGISLLPILLLPDIAFTIMIAADIGGLYGMGIYMLLTAERILIETLGRD